MKVQVLINIERSVLTLFTSIMKYAYKFSGSMKSSSVDNH